jgi:hypothetical protein
MFKKIITISLLLFVVSIVTNILSAEWSKQVIIPHLEKMPALVQPDGHTCGPTCGAMLLQYYGKFITITTMADKNHARTSWFKVGPIQFSENDWGYTHPRDLRDAISKEGVANTLDWTCSAKQIIDAIDQGKPVLALVRPSGGSYHWIIIVGYGYKIRELWLRIRDTDGELSGNWIPFANFDKSWALNPNDYRSGEKHDYECNSCKGDGNGWTKCAACGGDGKLFSSSTLSRIFGRNVWTKCNVCNGSGKWTYKCPKCLGSGNFNGIIASLVGGQGVHTRTLIIPHIPANFSSTNRTIPNPPTPNPTPPILSPTPNPPSNKPIFGIRCLNRADYKGVTDTKVLKGNSGAKAGLEKGDVILEIDGRKIRNEQDYINAVDTAGKIMNLKVRNVRNGQILNIRISL